MRIKGEAIDTLLKSHLSSALIDGIRDAQNPFDKGEHIVMTGSANAHYMWYKGLQDNFIYKPPSDIDFTLSIPQENERSIENVSTYRNQMLDMLDASIGAAGAKKTWEGIGEYDGKIYVKRTYSADEIKEIFDSPRMQKILHDAHIDDIEIPEETTVTTELDMLVLDNAIVEPLMFDNSVSDQNSALRREAPESSIAFKLARAMLADKEDMFNKPADKVDVHNILQSPDFNYDPATLRIMTVVALSRLANPTFDFSYSPILDKENGAKKLQDGLRGVYNRHFMSNKAMTVMKSWNDLVSEVFPEIDENGAPVLTEAEEDFIYNCIEPYSGDPRRSIKTDLLQKSDSLKSAFDAHPEMKSQIENSTFSHHRIAFRQIAPEIIPI